MNEQILTSQKQLFCMSSYTPAHLLLLRSSKMGVETHDHRLQ